MGFLTNLFGGGSSAYVPDQDTSVSLSDLVADGPDLDPTDKQLADLKSQVAGKKSTASTELPADYSDRVSSLPTLEVVDGKLVLVGPDGKPLSSKGKAEKSDADLADFGSVMLPPLPSIANNTEKTSAADAAPAAVEAAGGGDTPPENTPATKRALASEMTIDEGLEPDASEPKALQTPPHFNDGSDPEEGETVVPDFTVEVTALADRDPPVEELEPSPEGETEPEEVYDVGAVFTAEGTAKADDDPVVAEPKEVYDVGAVFTAEGTAKADDDPVVAKEENAGDFGGDGEEENLQALEELPIDGETDRFAEVAALDLQEEFEPNEADLIQAKAVQDADPQVEARRAAAFDSKELDTDFDALTEFESQQQWNKSFDILGTIVDAGIKAFENEQADNSQSAFYEDDWWENDDSYFDQDSSQGFRGPQANDALAETKQDVVTAEAVATNESSDKILEALDDLEQDKRALAAAGPAGAKSVPELEAKISALAVALGKKRADEVAKKQEKDSEERASRTKDAVEA